MTRRGDRKSLECRLSPRLNPLWHRLLRLAEVKALSKASHDLNPDCVVRCAGR